MIRSKLIERSLFLLAAWGMLILLSTALWPDPSFEPDAMSIIAGSFFLVLLGAFMRHQRKTAELKDRYTGWPGEFPAPETSPLNRLRRALTRRKNG